jgi:hypothetical protein
MGILEKIADIEKEIREGKLNLFWFMFPWRKLVVVNCFYEINFLYYVTL